MSSSVNGEPFGMDQDTYNELGDADILWVIKHRNAKVLVPGRENTIPCTMQETDAERLITAYCDGSNGLSPEDFEAHGMSKADLDALASKLNRNLEICRPTDVLRVCLDLEIPYS